MNIFYNTTELTISDKISILDYAKENCTKLWVDILDCNKSFSRKEIKMGYDEIKNKINTSNHHFVVINRNNGYEPEYGEIGFSTLEDPSYFLFILCSLEELYKIIDKFNLKKL